MASMFRRACLMLSAAALWLPGAATAQGSVTLEPVASGLDRPVGVVSAEDGSGRLFLVEQGGRIKVLNRGNVRSEPFLDLTGKVSCCRERGLLGLAFHPGYADNGFFFVNYTDLSGDSVVARFRVSADPNRADPGSERRVLGFDQPFANHNGGHLAFGPDGYLYIATGDGGSGGDPQNNAQNLSNLLGKLLRVDVDRLPAAIPPDNPFLAESGARPEIWAYGLRNPWRFSFDRETGDLFVADVGQRTVEEVNRQLARSRGGENYGWRRMEGSRCFQPPTGCNTSRLELPILEYSHALGCSVTGGFRHRGTRSTDLNGLYIYGDFCAGTIWGAEPGANGRWVSRVLLQTSLSISSFGEDADGEVYVVDLSGAVYRIVGNQIFADGFESGDLSAWRAGGAVEVVQPGFGRSDFALAVGAGSGRSFVRTTAPRREDNLTVSFFLDANGVDLGRGAADVLRLRNGARTVARLELEQVGNRRYRASLFATEDGGERLVARTPVPASRAVPLAIEWSRGGRARLVKKNRGRGAAQNLSNSGFVVTSLDAGLPGGSPAGSSGSIVLDEFVISR